MKILSKHILLVFIGCLFFGCKTEYATKDFIISDIPQKPDYSDISSWAAHPQKKEGILNNFYTNKESLKADVFYIYPTLLTSKDDNNWNSDIYNVENKKELKILLSNIKHLLGLAQEKYIHLITDKFTTDPFMNLIPQMVEKRLVWLHTKILNLLLNII